MSGKPIVLLSAQRKLLDDITNEDVNQFLSSLLADGREVVRRVKSKR